MNISGRWGVSIGDGCGVASKVSIHSSSHHFRSHADRRNEAIFMTPLVDADRQALIVGPVVLGDNVGVALNATILPGVTVAKNSFVNISPVVPVGSRYSENSIIGGDPARRLGPRFLGVGREGEACD
jgi:acetyltransferase-like isoleucine patch superfamily enzyme